MRRFDPGLPRLFVEVALAAGAAVKLDREQAHYLVNVLRLSVGDGALVFNGREGEWRAILARTGKREALLDITAQTRVQTSHGRIVYAFAPLKHTRLDYVIQKAVELGAAEIVPVLTRRTVSTRFNQERARANAIEAAEQCGVLALPLIREPLDLEPYLATLAPESTLVFCDEEAEARPPLAALSSVGPGAVVVLIGPEGGFDDSERRRLLAHQHVIRLSLGPRILRADTAGVAALALVQAACGDWR